MLFSVLSSALQQKERTAELKIMFVFVYFMVFLIVLNCREAVYSAQYNAFKNATNSYFLCEAVGYVPGKCSREVFEQYSYPLLNIVFYVTALLVPVVNLLFVINCRILKENIKQLKIVRSLKSLSSRSSE